MELFDCCREVRYGPEVSKEDKRHFLGRYTHTYDDFRWRGPKPPTHPQPWGWGGVGGGVGRVKKFENGDIFYGALRKYNKNAAKHKAQGLTYRACAY